MVHTQGSHHGSVRLYLKVSICLLLEPAGGTEFCIVALKSWTQRFFHLLPSLLVECTIVGRGVVANKELHSDKSYRQ